jgi:hypothetical protein
MRWLLVIAVLGASTAHAAEVVVKGEDLEGTVEGVTSDGVEFTTVYGSGVIVIPWNDIEALQSDKEFMVLHGEDAQSMGRLWGVEQGELLVGETPEQAERVPVGTILRSLTREKYETSWPEAMRARYRYWSANLDLGLAYIDATTNAFSFNTGLELERKKKSSRLQLGAYYRFGTTQPAGDPEVLNENRVLGRARYDHDIWDSVFGYGAVSGEYNQVQKISIRTDPNAGLGWRFLEREKLTLSAHLGAGYVYQRYFGGDTDDFPTLIFGGELEWLLPLDSKITGWADYQPSLTDWTQSYLIRAYADWTVPIIGWLDFKFSVLDEYNNAPAPDTQRNSLTLTTGLSVGF